MITEKEMVINFTRAKFVKTESRQISKEPPCIDCITFSSCFAKVQSLYRLECTPLQNWIEGDLQYQQLCFDRLKQIFKSVIYVVHKG